GPAADSIGVGCSDQTALLWSTGNSQSPRGAAAPRVSLFETFETYETGATGSAESGANTGESSAWTATLGMKIESADENHRTMNQPERQSTRAKACDPECSGRGRDTSDPPDPPRRASSHRSTRVGDRRT